MRWLLFLSRLAFICGIFFLLAFSLQMTEWTAGEAISSTIIMIGVVMGLVIVPAVNICYLVVLFVKRKIAAYVPLWLVVGNILFFFILIFYIFHLNVK